MSRTGGTVTIDCTKTVYHSEQHPDKGIRSYKLDGIIRASGHAGTVNALQTAGKYRASAQGGTVPAGRPTAWLGLVREPAATSGNQPPPGRCPPVGRSPRRRCNLLFSYPAVAICWVWLRSVAGCFSGRSEADKFNSSRFVLPVQLAGFGQLVGMI